MSRMLSLMALGVAAVGFTLANPSTSQAQSFGVHLDFGRTHIDFARGGYYPNYQHGHGHHHAHHHYSHYRPYLPEVLVRHGNHYHAVPAYSPPVYVTPRYYDAPSYYRSPSYYPSGPRVIYR